MNSTEISNTDTDTYDGNTTDALLDELIHSCNAEAKFTSREKEMLALFNEAQELELEAALLRVTAAQRSTSNDGNGEVTVDGREENGDVENGPSSDSIGASRPLSDRDASKEGGEVDDEKLRSEISKAEHEGAEARAGYMLRNKIVRNVVIAHPVLKAVHGGRDETFADRAEVHERLLPLINDRDILSMLQTNLAEHLVHLSTITAETSRDVMLANKENERSAATLRELIKNERDDVKSVEEALTSEQNDEKGEDSMSVDRVGDNASDGNPDTAASASTSNYTSHVRKVRRELHDAERERRMYKSIARGLVVNSGIDWARDDQLLEMVMDDEVE